MEIIQERLEREFDLDLVTTAPSVVYNVIKTDGEKISIDNPTNLPPVTEIDYMEEPFVDAQVITPQEFANDFDLVVAETEGRTLVRYFRQDEDGTYLQSTAETDDSTEPCKNAVTIVARVISVYHRI